MSALPSARLNIGILATYFSVGEDSDSGIARHYRVLSDALSEAGHRVHVVLPGANPEHVRMAAGGTPVAWTYDALACAPPQRLLRCLRRSWPAQVLLRQLYAAKAADRAIADAHRRRPFDIVETHAYDAPALFLLRRRDRPPVLTRVSTTMAQMIALSAVRSRVRSWQAALEHRVTRDSDALVTHALQHRDAVCALEGHDPHRFAIVPHGLPDPGEPAVVEERSEVEFLFVGRFEARKGVDVLLDAIPAVAAACPEAVFRLVGALGDGRDWRRFEMQHPHLAGSRVIALGRVSQRALQELYRHCSVLVAPSRYESFGLIYLEAMSHGKPAIGCAAGGVPEVIADGVTGLLAQPGDAASLTDCMVRLAGDRALRRRLGDAARREFVARFSAARMAEMSTALYRHVMSSARN